MKVSLPFKLSGTNRYITKNDLDFSVWNVAVKIFIYVYDIEMSLRSLFRIFTTILLTIALVTALTNGINIRYRITVHESSL